MCLIGLQMEVFESVCVCVQRGKVMAIGLLK